jgi:hypothetical protein
VALLEPHVHSWLVQAYEKDARWYAGESIPGWKSWAECKAEQERIEARKAEREAAERRKIERQGITPDDVAEWREALQGLHIERDSENPDPDDDDAAEVQRERLDDALTAMHAMLDHITGGSLMDPQRADLTPAPRRGQDHGQAARTSHDRRRDFRPSVRG